MPTSVPKWSCLPIPDLYRFFALSPTWTAFTVCQQVMFLPLPYQFEKCKKIFDPSALSDIFQTRAPTCLPFSSSSIYQLFIFRLNSIPWFLQT